MEEDNDSQLNNGSNDTNPFRNNFYSRTYFDSNAFSTNDDTLNYKQDSVGEGINNFEYAEQEYQKLMNTFKNYSSKGNNDTYSAHKENRDNSSGKLWHKNQPFDPSEHPNNTKPQEDKPIEPAGKTFDQIVEENMHRENNHKQSDQKGKPPKREFLKRKREMTSVPKTTKKYKYYVDNFSNSKKEKSVELKNRQPKAKVNTRPKTAMTRTGPKIR